MSRPAVLRRLRRSGDFRQEADEELLIAIGLLLIL